MKKIGRRWLWAGLALACMTPTAAEAQIGLVAGYNRDTLGEFLPDNGFDLTDLSDGFHGGVFLNLNLSAFSLRPTLVYHSISGLVAEAEGERLDFDISMVEIAADVRYRLPAPVLRPYLVAGPVFAFPSSNVDSVKDVLNDQATRLEAGIGLELNFGITLWPEIRYGRSLSALMGSDIQIGDSRLRGDGEPRLDTFTIRLGFSL